MTQQDIQNILSFLNRAQLNGNEAMEMVRLQHLLVNLMQVKEESPEAPVAKEEAPKLPEAPVAKHKAPKLPEAPTKK